jgi:outer membrane protein assembly factor BamB
LGRKHHQYPLQSAEGAQLAPEAVSRLKLKWAFGFQGAKAVYGQPTVASGRVFLGVDTGSVYSIDASTGCMYWMYKAAAAVRSAVSVGPGRTPGEHLAYFGDLAGNAYALNAATGEQVWKTQVEIHPAARITAAPQLYQNRLYIPVASLEEASALDPAYQCCTFRGSVVAVDALTGRQIWKTYVIPDAPKPAGRNAKGTQQFTPSGGGVWNSPTLDPAHRALYVGTGDAYTNPAYKTTDAILALDMDNAKVLWSVQDLAGDAWVVSCIKERNALENCPKDAGPDFDFGASPILRNLPSGKTILVAAQKSGIIWAHDPEHKGAVVWKTSVASKQPGPQGQVNFGGAADERNAYFGLDSGGIVALSLQNGERLWFTDDSNRCWPPRGARRRSFHHSRSTLFRRLGWCAPCGLHQRRKNPMDLRHAARFRDREWHPGKRWFHGILRPHNCRRNGLRRRRVSRRAGRPEWKRPAGLRRSIRPARGFTRHEVRLSQAIRGRHLYYPVERLPQ